MNDAIGHGLTATAQPHVQVRPVVTLRAARRALSRVIDAASRSLRATPEFGERRAVGPGGGLVAGGGVHRRHRRDQVVERVGVVRRAIRGRRRPRWSASFGRRCRSPSGRRSPWDRWSGTPGRRRRRPCRFTSTVPLEAGGVVGRREAGDRAVVGAGDGAVDAVEPAGGVRDAGLGAAYESAPVLPVALAIVEAARSSPR